MLKYLPVLLLASSLIQPSKGSGSLVSNQYYSACTNTGFPNFSYAEGIEIVTGIPDGSFTCSSLTARALSPPFQIKITWYYYATYKPTNCHNPDLPDGDQCCHSTATSTISLYFQQHLTNTLAFEVLSTGNVTAGAFLGKPVSWTLLDPNVASINFNCLGVIGQEAWTGLSSLTIGNGLDGPVCPFGVQFVRACPGWTDQLQVL